MISIVLYGRNDSYGYNLHKRAALSLNCMAEVLTSPSDEILFVDYNTPDDYPTFPEAIQDTLTDRAKEILRIFRVRPRVHERFKSKTHLVALEPIARNVAIRRSSEANRWILSTNTDMVFVPRKERSLSEIVRGLPSGFYHAPRIEIPEVLWESLNRKDPSGVISTVRDWGSSLHLNEIVLGSKLILYDGPGDFQLILRSDLFEHYGFDESMLLGWHVDSNMAARMHLKYGQVGDLGQQVYGYHCDHTRQVTPAHSHSRVQNDWRRFVTEVRRPEIPEQADIWGCSGDLVEELRLTNRSANFYVQALRGAIGAPLAGPKIVQYTQQTFDKVDYAPQHILPFLADMFASMPRDIDVAWHGLQQDALILFARIWEALDFSGKILVDRALPLAHTQAPAISERCSEEVLTDAGAFIFDFGGVPSLTNAASQPITDLRSTFLQVIRAERNRLLRGDVLRRIIALNAINNEHEWFVCGLVAAATTPFATHMRHGFVLPPKKAESWLATLQIGEAGIRQANEIRNLPSKRGWIAYGPHKYPDEGIYEISLRIQLLDVLDQKQARNKPCLVVEVRAGPNILAVHLLRYEELLLQDHRFDFPVLQEIIDQTAGIETRIAAVAPVAISLRELTVRRISDSVEVSHNVPVVLELEDWLPFLQRGELGETSERGVIARTGSEDFVVYGPYWSLPKGRYELTVRIEDERTGPKTDLIIMADVLAGDRQLAAATFELTSLRYCDERAARMLCLPFEVGKLSAEKRQVETRIRSSGSNQFTIRSVAVKAVESPPRIDLLPFFLAGKVGEHDGGEIRNIGQKTGIVAYSPILRLEPHTYRLKLLFMAGATDDACREACALLVAKSGPTILEALTIKMSKGFSEESEVILALPPSSERSADFQILVQVFAPVDIRLRALTIEPVTTKAGRTADAPILRIENWLPFLRTKVPAQGEDDGVVVGEGDPGYAIHGPYWTMPPGDYELIASVVPLVERADGRPAVTVDVTTEDGRRTLAAQQWHLGHLEIGKGSTAVLRLPFTIAADPSPVLRTIETRVFTSGEGRFRVSSLTVMPKSLKREQNWFRYLAIAESGIHTGNEIRSIAAKRGYIASTPVMKIEPGSYSLNAEVVGVGDQVQVGLEIWSAGELIAIGTAGTDRRLEFAVTENIARVGVKLNLRAVTAAVVSIRSLIVERTPMDVVPNVAQSILGLDNWLPFLRSPPIVHAEENGIAVAQGEPGYVIYGPDWTLPPGDYELVGSIVPLTWDSDGKPFITIDVSTEAGQRRLAEHRWKLGCFQPSGPSAAWDVRLPFTLSDDLAPALRTIETRIFTSGDISFRVLSLAVRRVASPPRDRKTVIRAFSVQRISRAVINRAALSKPLRAVLARLRSVLRN